MSFLVFPLLGLIIGTAIVVVWFIRRPSLDSLHLQILLIKVPKSDRETQKDFTQDINLSEQLFSALAAIKKPFVFEMAVHSSGPEILFYLGVPRESLPFAKQQIEGLFPEAQVEEAHDYTIFSPAGESVAGRLALKENDFLPIRTYKEAGVDTFASVVTTFSKLADENEGAAFQVVVQPEDGAAKKNILQAIVELKKGKKFKEVMKTGFIDGEAVLKAVGEMAAGRKVEEEKKDEIKIIDEEMVKALSLKVQKPLFLVNARVVTSGPTLAKAEDLFLSMAGSFTQFASPLRNSFKIIKTKNQKRLIYRYIFRDFAEDEAVLLNTEELTSLFHLPTSTTDVPRIKWLRTKEAPAPAVLPQEGVTVGVNDFRGEEQVIKMAKNDRRRHTYLIGQTGTGKSTLMLNMAVEDMEAGNGLCVIDPHGDFVEKMLERVPKNRINDVIVFNPGDLARPLGLNMLEYDFNRPEEKSFIVNEMLSIFNRLYDLKATGGPMFEYYLRNALLLMMEDMPNEPVALLDVPRIFTDEAYRNRKLARIKDPLVIDFWTKEVPKAQGDQGLGNMAPYIVSKFASFISNEYMRPIIGQTKSAFNFREIMDNKKILLVNLAKGRIGDLNANLLGMIMTGRILFAALSRTDIAEDDRQDFYLYIDEFQNFTTDSIAVILSEARKYKLDLVLAHQFIAQLEDDIREAVFGNVGSMIAFRVGATDGEFLEKQFSPTFSARDLITVENYHGFAKMLVNGEPAKPFNLRTLAPKKGSPDLAAKLKELSSLTYGADISEIEKDILDRLRS